MFRDGEFSCLFLLLRSCVLAHAGAQRRDPCRHARARPPDDVTSATDVASGASSPPQQRPARAAPPRGPPARASHARATQRAEQRAHARDPLLALLLAASASRATLIRKWTVQISVYSVSSLQTIYPPVTPQRRGGFLPGTTAYRRDCLIHVRLTLLFDAAESTGRINPESHKGLNTRPAVCATVDATPSSPASLAGGTAGCSRAVYEFPFAG